MKIEIIKEFSVEQDKFFHMVYLNGIFQAAKSDLEDAYKTVENIKRNLINPTASELIYSEDF